MPGEQRNTERTGISRRSTATGRYEGPTGSRRTLLKGVVAVPAALSIGLRGTVGRVTAQDGRDDAARTTANVVLRDQPTDGRIVVAESVRLPDGGYVGIHDEQLFSGDTRTSMIGTSEYLDAGEHETVAITLFELEGIDFETGQLFDDQYLLAAPHRETTKNEVNEYAVTGGEDDGPYMEAGAPIVDMGHVTVIEDGNVASVSFRNQLAEGETVTVATVTLSDGGFVALHDAATFRDDPAASVLGVSQYLGYGIHEDVEVRLFRQATGVRGEQGSPRPLVAVPHLDTNGNEAFDFLESGGAADGPYLSDGRLVADFGFIAQ